ncbi:hypothetical protein LZZ85_02540 [Terrimonas sp. NA20]|uniref:Uncharacterized protein n=1 Tax=Terrimonas ginsenosidimutans TaxID=2908004 RepID=A0ABS9KLC9_9BACT|nr:hypothetical protein [Terrimonas ginsenosidimutans]MCG2613133.1 hypothetical protein [Terrimonas ginsenosidimutans]
MKIIYTLLIMAVASVAISSFTTKNYIYYFCDSRTMNSSGKKVVRISPLYAIPASDTAGWQPAHEWANWVNQEAGETKVTSDFNYYFSKADAKKQLNNAVKRYSDTSKYVLKRVDFRLASKK